MMGYGHFFGGGLFGFLFMVLFWGLILVGFFYLVKFLILQTGGMSERDSRKDDSIRILKERYARGEITREEFERMKGDLL